MEDKTSEIQKPSRRTILKSALLSSILFPLTTIGITKERVLPPQERPLTSSISQDKAFTEDEYLDLKKRYLDLPDSWDKDQIQVLESLLPSLPPKFYSPRGEKPMRCILVPPIANSEIVYSPSNDTLYLNYLTLEGEDQKENLGKIAGALATRIALQDKPELLNTVNDLFKPGLEERLVEIIKSFDIGVLHNLIQIEAKLGRSSYAELLLKISKDPTPLGARDKYLKGYIRSMKSSQKPLSSLGLSSEEQKQTGLNLRLVEALAKGDPLSFIDKMSGFYTLGPKGFHQFVGQFFTSSESQVIYDLLKTSVFNQKRY